MYYQNVYGRENDASSLDVPSFELRKDSQYKVEFYYYIKSSGYQALEVYKSSDESRQFHQIWRSEAVPEEAEEVWTYACMGIPNHAECTYTCSYK